MATLVSRSIGSTGYYSSVQAWDDDCPANLVTADQVWQGKILNEELSTSTTTTISGITTDSTRYMELTTDTGASFADNANKLTNALKYNASNGAAWTFSGSYAAALSINISYFRLNKIQFTSTSSSSYGYSVSGIGVVIDQCIFGGAGSCGLSVSCSSTPTVVRNTLIYTTGSGSTSELSINHAIAFYQPVHLMNVTVAKSSNLSAQTRCVYLNYAQNAIIKNCAFYNGTTPITGIYTNHTVTHTATDRSSLGGPFSTESNNLTSQTYANQFEQPDATGSLDFRTKSGSNHIDAGTDTSGYGVTTDIVGTTRSGTYDISAWESAGGGGGGEEFVPRVIFM